MGRPTWNGAEKIDNVAISQTKCKCLQEKVESQILLSPKFRNKVDDMGEDICS